MAELGYAGTKLSGYATSAATRATMSQKAAVGWRGVVMVAGDFHVVADPKLTDGLVDPLHVPDRILPQEVPPTLMNYCLQRMTARSSPRGCLM